MDHLFLYAISDIIITLVIGGIAGYLAEFIVPGRGFGLIVTIAIGMAGGFLGNWLFKDYLNMTHNDLADEIIRSTAGAIILCIVLNVVLGNSKGKNKKEKDVYDWSNE